MDLLNMDIYQWTCILAKMSSAQYVLDMMPKSAIKSSASDVRKCGLDNVSLQGLFLEFGVASGNTINEMSSLFPSHKFYGFDSFGGLPETWRSGFEKGIFLQKTAPDVNNNVELIVGLFNETLPNFLWCHKDDIAFLHIDCDLYSSTKTIFDLCADRIKSGTIICFDEYFGYPSWQEHEHKAFVEFTEEHDIHFEYIAYNMNHEQVAVKIL